MKDPVYIDEKARKDFDEKREGIKPEILGKILDGANELGWWRSMRVRASWRRLVSHFSPDHHAVMRRQYCP
jgi:hypothetical protein